MHILICNYSPVPVFAYGGTERVIWDLAKNLVLKGHEVSFWHPVTLTALLQEFFLSTQGRHWKNKYLMMSIWCISTSIQALILIATNLGS